VETRGVGSEEVGGEGEGEAARVSLFQQEKLTAGGVQEFLAATEVGRRYE
jgi:hypothetical protein